MNTLCLIILHKIDIIITCNNFQLLFFERIKYITSWITCECYYESIWYLFEIWSMHTHVDNYKINQGDGIGLNGETNVQREMYNTYQNSKDYFVKETITYRDNKISQSFIIYTFQIRNILARHFRGTTCCSKPFDINSKFFFQVNLLLTRYSMQKLEKIFPCNITWFKLKQFLRERFHYTVFNNILLISN